MPQLWIDRYRWWLCALSGFLLVAAFPPFSCALCGWIALVPAWWVITRSESARRRPIRHGYLTGLLFFGGTFWWIGNVTVIGAIFIAVYMALYPGIWFLLIARLCPASGEQAKWTLLPRALLAAAFWVTLEWWRSWFLSGFDWNELGTSQGPSLVFRQLAAFGGVPLISFLLVTINILWAEAVLDLLAAARTGKRIRLSLPLGAGLLLVAVAFALGWHHLQRHRNDLLGAPLTFAAIQPDIPQIPYAGGPWINFQQKEDAAIDVHVKLSQQAIADHPDLLIWPEATTDEGVFQDRPMNEAVHDLCQNYGGDFLLGSQDFDLDSHKLYNCAYFFSSHGDLYDEYRKTQLVVLGEYVPLASTFPWLRNALGLGLDFSRGPGPRNFVLTSTHQTFSPLICFEDTLAGVAARAAKLHPDFFINMSNDGWYQGWCAAWGIRQHLNLALFRCVEHDRPMIRCTNNGISCVIDQDGAVVDRLRDSTGAPIDVRGIFRGQLRFYPARSTVYEAAGDWIVLISQAATAMLGVSFLLLRRESRPHLFRRRPVL